MGRLILVRHGRSAHVHDGTWIDRAAATRFEEAYDVASIPDEEVPPPNCWRSRRMRNAFLTSDVPRAIASVRLLASGNQPER